MSVAQSVVGVSRQLRLADQQGRTYVRSWASDSGDVSRSILNGPPGMYPARSFPVPSGTRRTDSTPVLGPAESLNQKSNTQAARKAHSPLPPLKEV